MSGAIAPFRERYTRALGDARLRTNLLNFQRAWRTGRSIVFGRLEQEGPPLGAATTSFADASRHLIAAKDAALADPDALRDQFVAAATQAGTVVHQVETPARARDVILRLLRERDVTLLAKGKSMVAEEIFLNHYLEDASVRVVETDLGEWIIQLAQETPSHMVMPAIHKSRQQVAALFRQETGSDVPDDDVKAQVTLAREELRRAFKAANAGMIGANALIAETGSVMLVTNEGNGDLISTLPPTLIVIAGWEKLLPTIADAAPQLRLLARSATGQEITTYTTFLTGPEPGREVHLVLLDNGRRAMWRDPDFRDALRCIRCAACADVCPPYQVVGGHVFGYVYSGAIGLVNTPFHHGVDAASGPQSLCVSCNACATVCPAGIPLPRQILDVRAHVAEEHGLPWTMRAAFAIWRRPRLFAFAARTAAVLQKPFQRGGFVRLPLPSSWSWRTPPALASQTARAHLANRQFDPSESSPWAESEARGKTIAYFVQCITDQFAPEQAAAAVRVLQACGARVVVPPAQHCCGLPAYDAGDRPSARTMAKHTIEVLEAVQSDYVVTAAASCSIAVLHDYPHLLRSEPEWVERAERLAARTMDVLTFLDRVARVTTLPPLSPSTAPLSSPDTAFPPSEAPVPPSEVPVSSSDAPVPPADVSLPPANAPSEDAAQDRVTFHSFCQSTNVAGLGDTGARLLRHAGYDVVDLPEADVCCGFGGSTSIEHPQVSRWIAARKLENVAATGASVLCTDNPGCLLHLRGAADAAGMAHDTRHVVELLAARLST